VLGKYQAIAQSEKIARLLDPENKKELGEWLHGRQIVDLLEEFPCSGLDAQTFCGLLRKLPPRLYSIASSHKAHPGEVHLTVAAVRYETHGRKRKGVASTFVADLLDQSHTASVYTHANKNFKLPASGDTPIIMVGPGTGIAPYRAFIEERAANGDRGKSWLFFGDQHYTYDFLYQLEWQDHLKSGALTRLDVAFSRDQKEKIYVQHRMLEKARDLWAWLEEGAHFYVCGDASRMAHDVHESLIQIAIKEGGLDRESATARIEGLKMAKRYQRDVY
jgi:sulfite reductase (NADPH) flavoprotein alpha-component